MELPQTHLIIRHFNANVVKQHYYGNSTSWNLCVQKCNDILTNGDCSCLSKDTNITCHDTVSDPMIPVVLWSLSSVILVILVAELIAIR